VACRKSLCYHRGLLAHIRVDESEPEKGSSMVSDVGINILVLLGVCLTLSGFFSGAEAAFLSVQRVRIHHLASTGSANAARVARLVEHPEKLLPPILLGNNLVNTAAAALATAVALTLLDDQGQAILAATVLVTVFLLVFGETIPKTISARHAERVALSIVLPLQWVQWVLRPVSVLLEWISTAAARMFSGGEGRGVLITQEEIRTMVSLGREAGTVESGEAEMIRRVLDFGGRRVREIMTPRPEMVGVKLGATFHDFLAIYDQHYHTRFPVFEGDVDKVVGLISVKDIMRAQARGSVSLDDSVTAALRPLYYAPETKLVDEVFDEMRAGGHQMAIVVDEFGGVAGLVTLKALVESIVGPVGEEGEAPEEEVVAVGEDSFEMDASLLVEEANQRMGLGLAEGEYDTVAGFILDRLGHLPEQGEGLTVDNLHFRVLEMKGVKIERIVVTRRGQVSE
jgi:putative hemolysin